MPSGRSDSSIKLITYSKELVDGKPFYAFSNSRPVKDSNREPAGHAFHSAARKLRGCTEKKPSDGEGRHKRVGDDDDDQEEEYVFPSFNPYANNKAKKKTKKPPPPPPPPGYTQQQKQDHYALLGLGNLRYLATQDQIKKSYREAALKHHPDKHAALIQSEETEAAKKSKKEEVESRFRAIQEAYEVLMDPTKRKLFDSTDVFDEFDHDGEDISPREFFKVFGQAFRSIAKQTVASKQQRVIPDLGDENTKLKEVDKFYKFWYGFKSVRVFAEGERYDPEKASSRQERRWMERENAKITEKARKEDDVRVRNLVENAYRIDPRILKRKEEEEAAKQRKEEAKVMAKKKQEEEAAARAAEAEKRRKEEAEYAQQVKKAKEKERKLLLKERNRLRKLSAHVLAQCLVSKEDVENLCMSLNIEQLQNLNDTMGNKQEVEELAKVIKDHEANSKEKESEKAKEKESENSREKESEKANGGGEAEPTKLDSTRKNQPWSKEEIDKLRKGIIKYPKGISRRWEVISDYIGTGRSVEEILKATKSVLLQKPDSAKAFDTFLEKRKPTVSIASPLSTREEELGETLSMGNNGEASGRSSDADGSWSVVQERALVQALKTFPKETSQRWERVAAAVPGKTMIQCKKKFAELKELIRSKKTGV